MRRTLAVGLLVATSWATTSSAQNDPRLAAAVRQAQEGAGDSARATVRKLLTATPTSDTLYAAILYTSAVIANDATEMQRQLQRVAVEFPISSWADDALLRLAQIDYAMRQFEAAAGNVERLTSTFPSSPLFPQAAYWAGRSYIELKRYTEACRWLADGMARTQNDGELQTQLGALYQRCDGDPAEPAVEPATKAAPASAPAGAGTTTYRVQLAAVTTQAAADAAVKQVATLGYRAVAVREGGLYKVRAGSFAVRADAQAAANTLKSRLGGTPFVVSDK